MINVEALFKMSYGMYLVSSGDKNIGNGFISNTVFQVTASPPRFAASCNKNNFTTRVIRNSGVFAVSILETDVPSEFIGTFGYNSGTSINKFQGVKLKYGITGTPIVLDYAIATLEFKVIDTVDVGTHILFIGALINTEVINESKIPMTYAYYREVKKGFAPANAPTYIDKQKLVPTKSEGATPKKYVCSVCRYIYDDAIQSQLFSDLPDNWVCPTCGSSKADFVELI